MRGSNVQLVKLDPYYNVTAGTMNPRQHGEVFLCDDGSETDLDLGHYERITGIEMSRKNITTSGSILTELLEEQQMGKYLGETVQVVPHVTDKIQEKLLELGKDCDIVIAEIGGTVGDMESDALYHAAMQMQQRLRDDVLVVMVAPVLLNETVKEYKTKPLQNSITTLRQKGLQADILLCRAGPDLPPSILDKIARMTNIPRESVFLAPHVSAIYEVPIKFWESHLDDLIADKFHLRRNGCRIHKYRDLVEAYVNGHDLPNVEIGIVGKYENCDEAYHSLKEALVHAAIANNVKLFLHWINAEDLEKKGASESRYLLERMHGIIVPGGFDQRGVEGKIKAIEHVRKNKIPFLGICLGLQCSVIEFCRNVLGIPNATSEEFDKDAEHKVVHFIEGQEKIVKKCGTMRLGAYDCDLVPGSIAHEIYKKKTISERHRHRYEVNIAYLAEMEAKGFKVTGQHTPAHLVEVMEIDRSQHPYFVGTQAHPEFKSRLGNPAPLFNGLIRAAVEKSKQS